METDLLNETISDITSPTPLPEGLRTGEQGGAPGRHCEKTRLRADTLKTLRTLAAACDVDLCSIFSAAWGILLNKYSGHEDVIFGFLERESDPSFSGIVPIRLHIEERQELAPWLTKVAEGLTAQRRSGLQHDPGPFETAMIFSAGVEGPLSDPAGDGLPLTLHVYRTPDGNVDIIGACHAERFRDGALTCILRRLTVLLDSMAANPGVHLSALALMSGQELKELLIQWNDTGADYPKDRCIHQLFEEQAQRTPQAPAAIFGGRRLSYRELDEKANRLAAHLRELGAGPDVVVAICIERSLEMLVAMLGILKSGAAYLPLDPAFPAERLEFLLADSQAQTLVTQEHLIARFPKKPPSIVTLDSAGNAGSLSAWTGSPEKPPAGNSGSNNLAYLIYTSGSTGKPKGVMVEHVQAVNFFTGMDRLIGMGPGVWLAVTSISFDISVLELLWTLTRGFTVVVQPESERLSFGEHSIAAQIVRYGVTHMQCTPSLARFLMVDAASRQSLARIRTLLLGGETLPSPLASQIRRTITGELFNVYGPTETTIWSTGSRITSDDKIVSIGRPIANTQTYILNRRLEPVPPGTPGELFIGGDGVTRGYFNRPALTDERFPRNPFRPWSPERIYKTGDLARYRPDGQIEFLGRIDNQVKILGFRIEPEEIEAVLGQYPGISAAAVVARDCAGDMKLEAYVVPGQPPPAIADLRVYLENKLPPQMLPAIFVIVDSLPVTPNGKLDKQALLARNSPRALPVEVTLHGAGIEALIQTIWREALDEEAVNKGDNFFDLGATSMMVAEVAGKLSEALGRDIPVTDLFQYPTIYALAAYLSDTPGEEEAPRRGMTRAESRKQALALRSTLANSRSAEAD